MCKYIRCVYNVISYQHASVSPLCRLCVTSVSPLCPTRAPLSRLCVIQGRLYGINIAPICTFYISSLYILGT